MNNLELWHTEENRLRRKLKHLDPRNDAFNFIYPSTYTAIEAYRKALDEIREVHKLKEVKKLDCKEIIDRCYELCESCKGRRDGYDPLVQNYLDDILKDLEKI